MTMIVVFMIAVIVPVAWGKNNDKFNYLLFRIVLQSGWTSTETQERLTLSRNGFQESASLLASSKCPSSKSLPTQLKYSQRNDASGNRYTCSFGTHKSNFLAEINTDRIAGLRSRTLFGHPDDDVRILMLSERLRNLEPRLRSSKAFFSPDFRPNHSNETPITIPVKKTNANLNQRCSPSARRLLKVVAMALGKTVVVIPLGSERFSSNHLWRTGVIRGISRRPQIQNRNCLSHLDIKPFGYIALLVGTLTQPTSRIKRFSRKSRGNHAAPLPA